MSNVMDGIALHDLFVCGYSNLKKNIEAINNLNVFPVPDGDTGANMTMSLGGGLQAANGEEPHVGRYMQSLSKGVLLSARGNSGVIFSQFIHGLYRGFADKETIGVADWAKAFACATEDAYNAIITPTEGTILTVIREASEFLAKNAGSFDSFQEEFKALQAQMMNTLQKTPELLPVLKEANVVDSGGAGLVCFIDGICARLQGEEFAIDEMVTEWTAPAGGAIQFGPDSRLEYGYCTEFVLQLMNYKTNIQEFDLQSFTKPLEELGDSIATVHNNDVVKLHIHTFTPEKVLEYGRQFGEFITLKIENMSVQHSQAQVEPKKREKYGIVSVASGEGIKEYFSDIGASYIIDGGQTNNPPVNAFLEAFDAVNADYIVVLPNNSNVILTAQQAAAAYAESDVRVLPTKSIAEGYSALSMMNLWCETVEELLEDMSSNLDNVTTGYVTTATRDAHMDGLDIPKGVYIGLDNDHIQVTGSNRLDTAKRLVESLMPTQVKDVIIVFVGAEVSSDEIEQFDTFLKSKYPTVDIGFIEGKQSVYDFIISLE